MPPGSKLMTEWLRALFARKQRKVVALALANEMAWVPWALITRGKVYVARPPPRQRPWHDKRSAT